MAIITIVPNEKIPPADFEEAISACGFGKFNIFLLTCTFPAFLTSITVTTALSYVLSSAECDLEMNMSNMGTLNIATYIGMMMSALIWGFLADTLGRKKIMVWGFFILALNETLASQSQSYWMLVLLKFFSGFVYAFFFIHSLVLLPYISELHPSAIRAKLILYTGIFYGIGCMALPLLAWSVIPNNWNLSMFAGLYELHSWHIFLLLCALPALASCLAMIQLPESPKFLMSRGRNEEALEVFRLIYAFNTGNGPDTYPVKRLVEETESGKVAPRGLAAIKEGFAQICLVCRPPYLLWLMLICFINSSAMLGNNTLRLWFPQIAAIVEDYNAKNEDTAPLCMVLDNHLSNKTVDPSDVQNVDCIKIETGSTTYVNSIIIGLGILVAYWIGGAVINYIGKRELSALMMAVSGACALAIFWSSTLVEVVVLFTVFVAVAGTTGTALASIIVDLFPTSIRAMAMSIFLMTGRIGTVTGGLLFPFFLNISCLAPFVFIAAIMFLGGILCYIIPKTANKRME